MSLILDALKKIDREKAAGEPGVVVVGSVPWGEAPPSAHRGPLALAAVLALGLVAFGAWWLLRSTRPGAATPATAAPGAARVGTESPRVASPARLAASPAVPQPTARPPVLPEPVEPRAVVPGPRPPAPADEPRAAATPFVPPRPTTPVRGESPADPPLARAPGAAAPAMPDLRLAAISVRDGQAVAIVNDRLVREGDSFDGVRIVRIGEAEVEVEFRGQRHVLRF